MRTSNIWSIVVAVLVVAAVIFLLVPAMQVVRTPDPRTQVINNFKQITLALHDYAGTHGALPPPAIYSKDGKPLLSWRVAILPYLEHEELYNKFKLDEPWDSPANIALLPNMPMMYDDFPPKPRAPNTTTFRVFVGPGTAFEGPGGISLKDFPDGTSNTLLVVEAAEAVPWTKPAEIAYSAECSLPQLGGRFTKHFMVGFADGSVVRIQQTVSEARLRAAITRNGGEKIEHLAD